MPSREIYDLLNENIDSITALKPNEEVYQRYQLNYKHDECNSTNKSIKSQGSSLVRADCYLPTKLKIYCLPGNAAEMTSTEGIAVGGSFKHFASQSYSNQVQKYSGEEEWLGFRCLITFYNSQTSE